VIKYKTEIAKPDAEREQAFQEKNIKQTFERIYSSLEKYNNDYEKALLNRMFDDAEKFEQDSRITAFDKFVKNSGGKEKLINMIMNSQITQINYFDKLIAMTPEDFSKIDDPVFSFVQELKKQSEIIEDENNRNEGKLNKLYGDSVDVKMLGRKQISFPMQTALYV
jgi:hypothetical protein